MKLPDQRELEGVNILWLPHEQGFHFLKHKSSDMWIMMVNFKLGNEMWKVLTAHNDFDSTDPSSMQDICHILTQLYYLALHEFS